MTESAQTLSPEQQIEQRALTLRGFNRPKEALTEVHQGIAEYPNSGLLWGLNAWLEYFHGDREVAGTAAERSLGLDPQNTRGRIILIELAVIKQDSEAAIGHARVLLDQYPDWAEAHHNLAYAILNESGGTWKEKRDRKKRVRAEVHRALQLEPENPEVMRRSVSLLKTLGDREEATALLDRALASEPENESLLLLAAELKSKSESDAIRMLTGVLAQNPQQRSVARTLSDTVWSRTQWLASLSIWILAAMLLFCYLLFGDELDLSHRARMNLAYTFLAVPIAWIMLFVAINSALPPKYLARLWKPVWWVWAAFIAAAIAGLAVIFFGLALAARSQEHSLEMNGPYVGGITGGIAVVSCIALFAELVILFARFRSESRNRLYVADPEGVRAARAELRGALAGLVRVGIGVVLAVIPIIAASIATRPEAAGAFATIAVAVSAPPLVTLLMRWSLQRGLQRGVQGRGAQARGVQGGSQDEVDREPLSVSRGVFQSVQASGAIVLAIVAVGVAGWLAYQHTQEYDPPPSPWEVKMQEQQRKLSENLNELKDSLPDVDALNDALDEMNGR